MILHELSFDINFYEMSLRNVNGGLYNHTGTSFIDYINMTISLKILLIM